MAEITLKDIKHTYDPNPGPGSEYALKDLSITWSDGGAYALLGPSGCGKTTLLNIISGLVRPSHGQIFFDDQNITNLAPDARNIAQVFQFPVIYDTMTVYENLAFPLKNRGVEPSAIDAKVREIAGMLELEDRLNTRASGLTADSKQKISLGRGLVRSDVNVIMFDEPLTVIDPHLKWVLRSKLKELHQRVRSTMIYVTHDQTEALTFADKVVVLHDGMVVQMGTPVELFEKPQHTFVGHFIGSPGMNLIRADVSGGVAKAQDVQLPVRVKQHFAGASTSTEVGIRPEFIKFTDEGLPVTVSGVVDAGRYRIVTTQFQGSEIKLLLNEGEEIPSGAAQIAFNPERAYVYADGWLVE